MSIHPKPLRAVLLAGGQGKRMKSSIPKVLHELLGSAIISRVLNVLDELALEHLDIIVGHQADKVISYLKNNPPHTPYFTHLQEPQLGSGHALMQAAPALEHFAGTLLVLAADSPLITSTTLRGLIQHHRASQAAVTILTAQVEDAGNYGRILRDPADNICGIAEATDADDDQMSIREINSAIYCLEWPCISKGLSSLKNQNSQKEYYLTDLVAWAKDDNLPVAGFRTPNNQEILGINSTLELAKIASIMKEKTITKLCLENGVTIVDPQSTWIAPEVTIGSETTILPGCYLTGKIVIGCGCEIGPGTYMTGPITIGDRTTICQSRVVASNIGSDCQIGPFAHLRSSSTVGDNVWVGNFVEVARSNVKNNTTAKHLSYLGDSDVGEYVNIGAGTIVANYDSVTKSKSRTAIKDGASTGSNSVIIAPVEIGEGSLVAAGTVITKNVPSGALGITRSPQQNKLNWVTKKKSKMSS